MTFFGGLFSKSNQADNQTLFSSEIFTPPNGATKRSPNGWFGNGSSLPNMPLDEAFLAVLIGAARADGSIVPQEEQELMAVAGRTKLLAEQTTARIIELRKKINEKIDSNGLQSVLTAACSSILNDAQRPDLAGLRAESIFAHVVDLVLVDRNLAGSEVQYVTELARQLRIDTARGKQIVSVMQTKSLL